MPGFLQTALGTQNQYTPYAGVNPMGTLSYNNGAWNQTLSPQQQGFNTQFGSQIDTNMSNGSMRYNPNTSFLPTQFSNFQNGMPGLPSLAGLQGVAGGAPNLTQYGNVNSIGNSFNNQATNLINQNQNFNQNWSSLFNSSVAAQQPYIQQFLQSNRDNEFAKGTLASTAGQYQTMGADQSVLNNLNSMQTSAFNNALGLYNSNNSAAANLGSIGSGLNLQQAGLQGNLANQQYANQLNSQQALYGAGLNNASLGTQQQQSLFNAANATQQMNEAQAEFGPQFANSQTNGLFNNILGQNNMLTSQLGLGLNAGYQQGMVNKTPSNAQMGTSGLLNGLLFGNGSGGLLGSLMGTNGSNGQGVLGSLGGSAGSFLNGLFGGTGTPGSMNQTQLNNLTGDINPSDYGSNAQYSDPNSDLENSNYAWGGDQNGSGGGYDGLTNTDLASSFQEVPSFNTAGGEAAASNGTQAGYGAGMPGLMSGAGAAANAALGLASGNSAGQAGGAIGAAKLGNQYFNGNNSQVGGALGGAGNALGIYTGLKQGGVAGDSQAAVNAAQLASKAGVGMGAVGNALPIVGAGLGLYNFATNWQSGKTGSDTVNGAEAGAAIGSVIPGIGTAIGAVVGAAVGALSSAFGGGAPDPETEDIGSFAPKYNQSSPQQQQQMLSSMAPQQSFQYLSGIMDAKNNSPGHSQPIEQVFGRMGESNLLNQMTGQINSAIQSGKVSSTATPDQLYSQVVAPWLNSKGASIDPNSYVDAHYDKDNGQIEGVLTNLIGAWQKGALTNSTKIGVSGETDSGLPGYAGSSQSPTAQAPLTGYYKNTRLF